MTIDKKVFVDQITVTENGIVLYREVTSFIENDVELSRTYHRISLAPGQNIEGHPKNVVDICNTAWTPEVITAYQAQQLKG